MVFLFFILLRIVINKEDVITIKTIKILSDKGTFEYEYDGDNTVDFYFTKVLQV